MFNFFRKKVDVLNHWIAFADGYQASPSDFYAAIERALLERKIPSMDFSRIEFPEGGLLSEKRVYLRMVRERLVFDVCAAPFGSGFFFSCRTSEIPLVLNLFQLFATLGFFLFLLWALTKFLGIILGTIGFIALVLLTVYIARNAVAMGLQDLDKMLIRSPLFGSVYEIWFRKETYHRIDSRLCYLEIVPTLVKKIAEETTAAKGVRLVRQYEVAPVLGDLYKPVPQSPLPPIEPPIR